MSNLKFDYLEPRTMITHRNWDLISQVVVKVKKWFKSKLAKTLTTTTWYLRKAYRMHRKIDNKWIEYQQLIDLQVQGFQWGNKIMLVLNWECVNVDLQFDKYKARNHHCFGNKDLCWRKNFVWITSGAWMSVQWLSSMINKYVLLIVFI